MPKSLIADSGQIWEVGKLIDQVGAAAYRDAKAAAGVGRMKPFHHLYRLEADTVIGILKQKLTNNERT